MHTSPDEEKRAAGHFLALQPRLDGGGTGYFDYADPVAFAQVSGRPDRDTTPGWLFTGLTGGRPLA
jgi:hypothetical protein